jgi:hypothetical protein
MLCVTGHEISDEQGTSRDLIRIIVRRSMNIHRLIEASNGKSGLRGHQLGYAGVQANDL